VISGESRGLRSLFSDSLVYGLSVGALPVALLVATPVLTRALDPDGYGTVDVLTGLSSLLAILALLGMDNAVARSWFDYADEDWARRAAVVRTGLSTAVVASAAVAAAAVVIAFSVGLDGEVLAAALAAFAAVPLVNGVAIARTAFLLPRRRGWYVLVGVLQALAGVTVAVALVVLGVGPAGVFLGLAAGALLAGALPLAAGGILGRPWLDRGELPRMLRYGVPLVPATASVWAIFAIDRTLVAWLRDLEEAGFYGLGARVTAPLLLAVSAFAVAWGPFILGQARERQPELRARALTAITAATSALFLLLFLFAEPIVSVLGGSDFEPGARAVPGVALGWVGWGAASVLMSEFAVTRRTGVIATLTGVAALANVLANLVMIPRFGFVAAAWVTAATFLGLGVMAWLWERRTIRAPYRWGRIALIGLTCCAAAPADLLTHDGAGLLARGLVCVGAISVLAAVALTDRPGARAAARTP